jgi:hypothetical protein
MFFIFASTFESSARISASPGIDGPGVTVPSIRPPVPLFLAVPVVLVPLAPPVAPPCDPDEFAVPAVFVPGAVGAFVELPAPLGSLPELLSPPAFAGPFGTPLTPVVPAPAEPAFGEPTALPVPADGPLAAPPVEAPPAEAPPADPPPAPPPPPPPLCANVATGFSSAATINSLAGKCFRIASLLLRKLLFRRTPIRGCLFPGSCDPCLAPIPGSSRKP